MRKMKLTILALQWIVAGAAFAQPAPEPRDKAASTSFGPNLPVSAAGANNSNNVSAAAPAGPAAKPTPGTFVVRMGGRVNVQAGMGSSH